MEVEEGGDSDVTCLRDKTNGAAGRLPLTLGKYAAGRKQHDLVHGSVFN